MATHSSILAWKITCTEEPGRLQSMRSKELDTAERAGTYTQTHTHTHTHTQLMTTFSFGENINIVKICILAPENLSTVFSKWTK